MTRDTKDPLPNEALPAMTNVGKSPAKVFISYSRKDRQFVEHLSAALNTDGYEVWVDLESIRPSEDWLNAIQAAIEGADTVVFVVSPDSIDPASVCAREIERAAAHNKRIVPVVCREIDTRTVPVPESIGRLNWIPFFDTKNFDLGVSRLREAIETDLEWAKAHTRMLVRAVEWNSTKRDDSYLLQKNDLASAERWLALGPEREPRPTTLQTDYILQSRAIATRRQRRLTLIGLTAALLVGIGGTAAVYESRQAGARRTEAISRQLSAEAQFELGGRLDRAILLTSQAFALLPLQEVLNSAVSVGQAAFGVKKILRGHTNRITLTCFLAGDRWLVSADDAGRVILWDTDTASPLQLLSSSAKAAACSSVTPVVAIAEGDTVGFWHVDGDHATRSLAIADSVDQIQFSQNGTLSVTADGENVTVRSGTGEIVGSQIHSTYRITALAVSDSGDLVAMGTSGKENGGEVSLWVHGERIFHDAPFAVGVKALIVDSKRGKVLAVGDGGEVKAWNLDGAPADTRAPEKLVTGPTSAAVFDANGDSLAIAQGRAAILCKLKATDTSGSVRHLAGHGAIVSAVALSANRRKVATGSEDGIIIVHRVFSENEFDGGWRIEGPDADDLTFSSDGTALIIHDYSKLPQRVPLPVEVTANSGPTLTPSKRLADSLAAATSVVVEDDRARLMDQNRKRELGGMTPEPGKRIAAACTTADGKRWVAATANTVRIANLGENRSYLGVVPSGFGNITSVAISPDRALVAVAGSNLLEASDGSAGMEEKNIVLIDGETGRTVGVPLKMTDPGMTLAISFSPNGQYLASAAQGVLNVWIAGPNLWLQRACAALDVGISAVEWGRRVPGTLYPPSCASRELTANPAMRAFALFKQ